jgi:cytidine deaminase
VFPIYRFCTVESEIVANLEHPLGVCMDVACGIGFCGEHAAVASMVTHGESRIHTIVAVGPDGKELPPCGRCRELIFQIDAANADTRVLLPRGKIVTIHQLLPDHWLLDR